jgi:anion transporter
MAAAGAALGGLPVRTGSRWSGLILGIGVCLAIIALPTPHGLSRTGQHVLAITALAVVLWIFQSMNNGVVSILMMGLLIAARIRPALVFSGFAGPSFWILVCVLFYGFAMQRTGLAQRISYHILAVFPGTYLGINCAFLLIGLVLSLGVPSNTVRIAIMAPIAWALVRSLKLPPRSRGAALIMLTSLEMAFTPGCAFLYGSLYGPVVERMFQIKNLTITWLDYAKVIAAPTLILCGLLILLNQLVMRPEKPLHVANDFARQGLRSLGAMKRDEWITGLVVVLSIVFWMTDRWHHLPSFLVGMLALTVFSLSGIVGDSDIGSGVSWSMLLFMGGVFGLSSVLQDCKLTEWLASFLVPVLGRLSFSVLAMLVVTALVMFAVRFLDPTGQIAVPVLFLPVYEVTARAGIPPLALTGVLLLAAGGFWLSYANVWVAMGEAITENDGFSAGQRVRLAHVYALVTMLSIVLAVGYWKLVHVM